LRCSPPCDLWDPVDQDWDQTSQGRELQQSQLPPLSTRPVGSSGAERLGGGEELAPTPLGTPSGNSGNSA